MKKMWLYSILSFCVVVLGSTACLAAHGENPPEKKVILVVAFGTTVPEAQKAFDRVDAQVKAAFPGTDIRWAYTSRIIRSKLAKQGKVLDSPEMALAKLMGEGFTHVAILSLQTIPGREYHDLYQNAQLFQQMASGFKRVVVALPLLSSHDDMVRVAKGMIKNIPKERKTSDVVLLMGHGTEKHPSDALYLAMNQVFSEADPNVLIATVDGYPSVNDILPKLRAKKPGKVFLMPFMLVAGDHARNDMAGDDKDSWKSILIKEGFQCEVVIKGTGEYPDIVNVWIDHLKSAVESL